MKLLTINVHAWQEENQLAKIKQLANVIHKNRYDAVALQEASQHVDAEIVYDSIREDNYAYLLNKELAKLGSVDYDIYWDISHYGFDVYEEGLALLVRHPLVKYESFYITDSTSIDHWKSRKIVGGTWQINDQPLSLYSCHLGWWDDEDESYKSQIDRLIDRAASGDRFLLLGDFNVADYIKGEGHDYILNKGLYDTHALAIEKTGDITIEGDIAGWDGNKQGLKIDYIFANWQANVKRSEIIFNGKNEPIISDHFGIEIELDVLKEE